MKKLLALIMALCMALSAIPALADVAETVADGETLTHDQLVEKALAEEGTFIVYGNTSRIATAAEAFGDGGFLYNRLFVWAGLVLLNEAADLKPRLSPVLLNAAFAAWIVQSPFVGTFPFFAGWIAANVALAALFLFRKRIKFR